MISITRIALAAPPFALASAVSGQLSVESISIGPGLSVDFIDHGDQMSVDSFSSTGNELSIEGITSP